MVQTAAGKRPGILGYSLRTGFALWALVVWGTAMESRGNMESLLQRLDLTRPDLAAVREAADGGDPEAASAALLEHFRTRRSPKWYTDPPPAPEARTTAADPAAEKILQREYTFVGKTATLARDIDWNANPLRDPEWPIELNRHYTWIRLAEAYNRTGNAAYIDDFIFQLGDWLSDNPRPASPREARFTWRTLECGLRLSGSWPRCFFELLNAPEFTPDVLVRMLESMGEQADYLTRHHGGGNWLVMETAGLMTAGVLFPEFRDAAAWRQLAFDRLAEEVDRQVPPDGAQVELTPHYHAVTMRSFMGAIRIAEFNGLPYPENVNAGILRMARYLMNVSKPDLRIPMFNDSDHDNVANALRPFATQENPDILYVLSRGAEGRPPPYTSVAMPYAGQFVLRSGWDEKALYLALDAGPYGAGHQHEDKLHVEVHAHGRSHILDPGRFTYAGGPWRSYFVGTESHSTMLVNGRGQDRRGTPRQRWIGTVPQDNFRVTGDTFDFVAGTYDEGYRNGLRGVTHVRKVFFKRGEYWIVHDLLVGDAPGDTPPTADIRYQFGTTGVTAATDGSAIVSHNPDANLAILPVSDRPFAVELHEGEENPPMGWVAWSLHQALKTPATLAVIRQTGTLPIRVDTVLFPYPGEAPPDIRIRRLPDDGPDGSALEILGPNGRDVYRCDHRGGTGNPPDAAIRWTRYDGDGKEMARAQYPDPAGATQPGGAALTVEPGRQALAVAVPAPGNLVVEYGPAAGGGMTFRRETAADAGDNRVPLPSVRSGQAYAYAVRYRADDGTAAFRNGTYVSPTPVAFRYAPDDPGDWSGVDVVERDGAVLLRATAEAATEPTYLHARHPLSNVPGDSAVFSLNVRLPFADGGDRCYCKLALTDTEGRTWSAYFASQPSDARLSIELEPGDFRRDDGGVGGRGEMPADAVLTMLAVTLRKGETAAPVAPVLEIDTVKGPGSR